MKIVPTFVQNFVLNSITTCLSYFEQLTQTITSVFKRLFPSVNTESKTKPEPQLPEVRITAPNGKTVFIIDGYVYDVTGFLDDHPAGPDILKEHSGKDVTKIFHEIQHSPYAKTEMIKYRVCTLAEWQKIYS